MSIMRHTEKNRSGSFRNQILATFAETGGKIIRFVDKAISGSFWKQVLSTIVFTLAVFSLFALYSIFWIKDKLPTVQQKTESVSTVKNTITRQSETNTGSLLHKLHLTDSDSLHKNLFNDELSGQCSNRYWAMVSQFLDPGNIDKADGEHRVFIALLAITGSATLGGLLIASISNGLQRRVDKINKGEVRYNLRDHTVIVGYDPYAVTIIKNTVRDQPNREIILFTSQNPVDVSRHLSTFLDEKEEDKVIIYHGGRDSAEQIKELDIEAASSLFILGEPDDPERDFMNWHCFTLIQEELSRPGNKNKRMTPLCCQVLFQHYREYLLAQNFDLDDKEKEYLEFRPINFHEEWSRRILSDLSVCFIVQDGEPLPQHGSPPPSQYRGQIKPPDPIPSGDLGVGSRKHLHIVIIGFDEPGKIFCANAMRTLHFPNLSTTNITLIDPNIRDKFDHFRSHFPGYASMYDIAFRPLAETPYSDTTRAFLDEIASDVLVLPYIVVCLTESEHSLAAGLNLPAALYKQNIPILIRYNIRYNDHGIVARLLQNSRYANVRFWGMMNTKIFDKANLDLREKFAESSHNTYRLTNKSLGLFKPENVKSKDYRQLPSEYQWSNRYLADSYQIKLRSAGFFVVENGHFYDPIRYQPVTSFSPDELQAMAQAEHARWVAERVVNGWSYGPERDDFHKIHNNIVPWEQLDETIKHYDYLFVENMLSDLVKMGYTIVRKIA